MPMLGAGLVAAFAMLETGAAASPSGDALSGVLHNFDLGLLSGWSRWLDVPYSHHTQLSSIRPPAGECVLWGAAERPNPSHLKLAAIGRRSALDRDSHGMWENGVFWYTVNGKSSGFADNSNVHLNSADVSDVNGCSSRLSWHLGQSFGGYRAGCTKGLNDNGSWRKIVMYGPCPGVNLRLAGGRSSAEGRVEVFHDGQWGTVCDDYFTQAAAKVTCRQLGYSGFSFVQNKFGAGHGPIWMDDVRCTGTEQRLIDCPRSPRGGWGNHNCRHTEDVSVECFDAHVRLAGSGLAREGRVEVYHAGEWGTVCDDHFGDDAAQVVCREMGLSGGRVIQNRFGAGSGQIWLDDVRCSGNEARLSSCPSRAWGTHNCAHSEDVAVECHSSCGDLLEYNWDYPGGDLERIDDVSSSVVCMKLCERNADCRSWTYVKQLDHDTPRTCYLKASLQPGRRQSGCCDSGLPRCNFQVRTQANALMMPALGLNESEVALALSVSIDDLIVNETTAPVSNDTNMATDVGSVEKPTTKGLRR